MRRKIMMAVLAAFMVLGLSGCQKESAAAVQARNQETGSSQAETNAEMPRAGETAEETAVTEPSEIASQAEAPADGANALIVYFSWSGNTESVAKEIQAQTGADLFEIVPTEPYTEDYNALLEIAQEEQASDARPAISGEVENFEKYDVVYFGYPNWWSDMPMILYTFLDEYDFSGKTIAPFVTSGGSGFSGTISAIESMEPEAEVTEGLSLGSSAAADPENAVAGWLEEIGL